MMHQDSELSSIESICFYRECHASRAFETIVAQEINIFLLVKCYVALILDKI